MTLGSALQTSTLGLISADLMLIGAISADFVSDWAELRSAADCCAPLLAFAVSLGRPMMFDSFVRRAEPGPDLALPGSQSPCLRLL